MREAMRPWEQKLFEKATTNIFCMNCWHSQMAYMHLQSSTSSPKYTFWMHNKLSLFYMKKYDQRSLWGSIWICWLLSWTSCKSGYARFSILKCQFLCGTLNFKLRNTKGMLLKYTIPIQREKIKVQRYCKSCNVPKDRRFLPIK